MFIVNRNSARADALVDKLGLPKRVHSRYYEDLRSLGEFDMIINATSAARSGGLPTLPTSLVGARTACVDLSYGEVRSEEHTAELQPLMRSSYAVFCLKK